MQKIWSYKLNHCSSGQLFFPFFIGTFKKIQNISSVLQYNLKNILRCITTVCAVLIGNG